MRKICLVMVPVITLFVTGCTDQTNSDEMQNKLSEMENRINYLEQTMMDQQSVIQYYEDDINSLEDSNKELNDYTSRVSQDLHVLNEAISLAMDTQTAILEDTQNDRGDLEINITYAEKINDDSAPNGFYLEEQDDDTLTIDRDVPIYMLENPSTLVNVEWDEMERKGGNFLQLFENDGEVVLIKELYIP
ncbi:hypothetical protein [Alkalibacillus aidingensis]|uniref:hypothetical protein n=1 Tax=Alkalibacillus aidingensis TaxID=2747607 RepID=UPI0016616DC4|nr:hypothetical protein [Alkalibacillus aidingensis]